MRLLVCGDRHWDDPDLLRREIGVEIAGIPSEQVTIIEGGAGGADDMARDAAWLFAVELAGFQADWRRYGRAAGPIRNQRMLTEGRPDRVLAFHDNLEASRGTKDMVERARRAGLPVRVVTH